MKNIFRNLASSILFFAAALHADGPGRIESKFLASSPVLTADPSAAHWRVSKPVIAENDRHGKPVAAHRTEIRSLWTQTHLYVLFTCPYEQLHLIASPSLKAETNKLWEYDVAEMFLGADFDNIHRYKEFQVSPQGEYVDLDIDRKQPRPEGGWTWNSGMEVKARIDARAKIWYGEMRIPLSAIVNRAVQAGDEMRINLYRIQGPPPQRVFVAWQPVNNPSYHTPEAFGRIVFVK